MNTATFRTYLAALGAAASLVGVTQANALESCSASAAAILSRSTGGTCAAAVALNQVYTLTYRIRNDSILDSGPNDGNGVQATIYAGEEIVATLAKETAGSGGTMLPGTLTFVPVCPAGSVGGSLNAGDPCNPNLSQCGTGVCGCQSALAGVTCTQSGNPNEVHLNITQDLVFNPSQLRNIATVRVKQTDVVGPPAVCGEFFTRMESVGDILTISDNQCASAATAGAQAGANLHAPECVAAADCGEAQCNVCANVGTNNHCEVANIGSACGTDGNLTDCVTPACVDVAGEGVCQQGQNDVSQGTDCTNNGGVPVPAVECQAPLCDANGTCANAADADQNGDTCGTDSNTNDCKTPACLAGSCAQGQLNVGQGTDCTNNGGVPVASVDCQEPLCDANGTCANTADADQNGDPCGSDSNTDDCKTPACLAGSCAQGQLNVGQGTDCTNNGGVPVASVDCQEPLCDSNGSCANVADADQDGDPCAPDSNTTDCKTPACLSGACTQEQLNAGQGTDCTNNGGVPVPAVDCQAPLCDSSGNCANEADASQNGDPCTDSIPTNCFTPECENGTCDQLAVCAPSENPTQCQVTISNFIFDDANLNGIQDVGEVGIPGVDVDVYSCNGNVLQTLEGTDTTDGSGLYSFSVATCNPSETLGIDVSDNFAGVLAGYTESPAFCDANNPGVCNAEVSPTVDSNCISGKSDCNVINQGATDSTVDCGYTLPQACEETCAPQDTGCVPCDDNYMAYELKDKPAYNTVITVSSVFGTGTVKLGQAHRLLAPATFSGGPLADPDLHYWGIETTRVNYPVSNIPATINFSTALGNVMFKKAQINYFQDPTSKSLSLPLPPPLPNYVAPRLCLVAATSSTGPKPTLTTTDQFGTQSPTLMGVDYACVTVNIGAVPPPPEEWLVCFTQRVRPPIDPPNVFLTTQDFAQYSNIRVDPIDEVCVPATRL